MDLYRIYLSGAMQKAADYGFGWRKEFKRMLHGDKRYLVIDPTEYTTPYTVEREKQNMTEEEFRKFFRRVVIEEDIGHVDDSDFLLLYYDGPCQQGFGSQAECWEAYSWKIPIYTVAMVEPPWWLIAQSTKVFSTLIDASEFFRYCDPELEYAVEQKRDKLCGNKGGAGDAPICGSHFKKLV